MVNLGAFLLVLTSVNAFTAPLAPFVSQQLQQRGGASESRRTGATGAWSAAARAPWTAAPVAAKQGTALRMSDEEEEDQTELRKISRAARKAGPGDRVLELEKPLGLLLEEDGQGDVFVAEVIPGGNAEATGKVNAGDKVVFVSATFGEDVWSSRGVGLTRVQSAIRLRSGKTVTLVLETGAESRAKARKATAVEGEKREAEESAQAKKDRLLRELEADTKKRKGIFRIF